MKYIFFLFIPFLLFGQRADKINSHNPESLNKNPGIETVNGLQFPANGDSPINAFIAFQFLNPQDDGLPIWGPSHQGVTWIWQYKPYQQAGYYVTFWWAENSNNFTWDKGRSNTYYGCHPYPRGGGGQTTIHDWEIAGMDVGTDNILTKAGSPLKVVKNVWYTQAFRVSVNKGGSKIGRFYIDLPDTSSYNVIEVTAAADWGEKNPPHAAVTFGDSPWGEAYYGTERLSGILGAVKIFNKALSPKDMKKEASDMSDLHTTAGKNSIWWGKKSYDTVDDLTCDYGTGRAFFWADAHHKAKLVHLQRSINFGVVTRGDSSRTVIHIPAGDSVLTIFRIALTAGVHFSVSADDVPRTLNIGDSLQAVLTFSPQAIGRLSDTLLITNSSTDNPIKFFLSGSGQGSAGVAGNVTPPTSLLLRQNHPNPFNSITTIRYQLPRAADIDISVFKLSGQTIKKLLNQRQAPGSYTVKWDGTNDGGTKVSSGVYLCRLRADTIIKPIKMILLR